MVKYLIQFFENIKIAINLRLCFRYMYLKRRTSTKSHGGRSSKILVSCFTILKPLT